MSLRLLIRGTVDLYYRGQLYIFTLHLGYIFRFQYRIIQVYQYLGPKVHLFHLGAKGMRSIKSNSDLADKMGHLLMCSMFMFIERNNLKKRKSSCIIVIRVDHIIFCRDLKDNLDPQDRPVLLDQG